jgi:hypothetical protein
MVVLRVPYTHQSTAWTFDVYMEKPFDFFAKRKRLSIPQVS